MSRHHAQRARAKRIAKANPHQLPEPYETVISRMEREFGTEAPRRHTHHSEDSQ